MSIKLISEEDLKLFLEEDTADFNDLFTQVIPQVSAQIETFLNRQLKEEARTQYFSGGRRYYYVNAFPINTTPAPIILENDVTQNVNTDFYTFEEEGLFEFQYQTQSWKPKAIKITWTGGYAADAEGVLAVPDDMKQACLLQCAYTFKRRRDLGNSGASTPNGNISYTGAIALLKGVKELLKPHQMPAGLI